MKLRPFDPARDFDALKGWVTDERTHALWCAGRLKYPLEKDDLLTLLKDHAKSYGDIPFTAADSGDRPVGFLCLAADEAAGSAMLRFIIIDASQRGRGLGRELLSLAAEYAFREKGCSEVSLMVFAQNAAARRCYLSAGFAEDTLTEKAFRFGNEEWDRLRMVKRRA